MLRPQVTMPFNNVPAPHTFGQQIGPLGEKLPLYARDVAHHAGGESETRVEQNAQVVGQAPLESGNVGGWRNQFGAGMSIEPNERTDDAVELPAPQPTVGDCPVEHLGLVETAHHNQPIDHLTLTTDCETAFGIRQRDDIEVNVRGKTMIELEFGPACGLAALHCGEVEIRETHRLFQLVGPIAGQKYQ